MSKLTPAQKKEAVKPCEEIVKKYPKTPTATEAAELPKELK